MWIIQILLRQIILFWIHIIAFNFLFFILILDWFLKRIQILEIINFTVSRSVLIFYGFNYNSCIFFIFSLVFIIFHNLVFQRELLIWCFNSWKWNRSPSTFTSNDQIFLDSFLSFLFFLLISIFLDLLPIIEFLLLFNLIFILIFIRVLFRCCICVQLSKRISYPFRQIIFIFIILLFLFTVFLLCAFDIVLNGLLTWILFDNVCVCLFWLLFVIVDYVTLGPSVEIVDYVEHIFLDFLVWLVFFVIFYWLFYEPFIVYWDFLSKCVFIFIFPISLIKKSKFLIILFRFFRINILFLLKYIIIF